MLTCCAHVAVLLICNSCRAKDQLKRMVKAHQTAVMQLSAAQLELQSAKAAAANELKQHMTRLQDKLQDRWAIQQIRCGVHQQAQHKTPCKC